MMKCQRCKSKRIANIEGKSSDCNAGHVGDKGWNGYIPDDLGIGGGDYFSLTWCLDCGQIQDNFPLLKSKLG